MNGAHSYNDVLPLMLARYCGPGLLGLGITALIAGFMSGMAGNVSAFTTVWTYDIYRPLINSKGSDHHYVNMGRWTTIVGVLISIGTAYLVMQFASIMDYVQALFSFFIAPLFGTVILGMLWKRATGPGGFWGLLCGTLSSISMWAWVKGRSDSSALRSALTRRQGPGAGHVSGAVVVPRLRDRHRGGESTQPSPSRTPSWRAWSMGRPKFLRWAMCLSTKSRFSGRPSWLWFSLFSTSFSGRRRRYIWFQSGSLSAFHSW